MSPSGTWVVVPCHNEADRLDHAEFVRLADSIGTVLFVDDGSTDDTIGELERLSAGHVDVHIERLSTNRGKAEAVRIGMNVAIDAGADVVGFLDADLATPVGEFVKLVRILEESDDLDLVIGARVDLMGRSIERSFLRHLLGRLYATTASLALGVGVYDTQCGAKVFRVDTRLRDALGTSFLDRWSFDAELISRLVTPASGPGASAVEVPLETWRDVAGSKLSVRASCRAGWSLVGVARRRRARERA